jgi:hypothetical protein
MTAGAPVVCKRPAIIEWPSLLKQCVPLGVIG